jgi:hypothetical protein
MAPSPEEEDGPRPSGRWVGSQHDPLLAFLAHDPGPNSAIGLLGDHGQGPQVQLLQAPPPSRELPGAED